MGPPDASGPLEYSGLDDFDPALLAARDLLDGEWDIFHAGHGYLAVPAGSVIFMAASIDALIVKIQLAASEAEDS